MRRSPILDNSHHIVENTNGIITLRDKHVHCLRPQSVDGKIHMLEAGQVIAVKADHLTDLFPQSLHQPEVLERHIHCGLRSVLPAILSEGTQAVLHRLVHFDPLFRKACQILHLLRFHYLHYGDSHQACRLVSHILLQDRQRCRIRNLPVGRHNGKPSNQDTYPYFRSQCSHIPLF